MIENRKQLKEYIAQDALANKRNTIYTRPFRSGDDIWAYIIILRKMEYYASLKGVAKYLLFVPRIITLISYKHRSRLLNFTIPIGTCGKGLSLAHYGPIVINKNAKIGENCRIHEGVTIGATNGSDEAPVVGNNVFIASGAKIIGNVVIPDDVSIGANAVVVKDVEDTGITIGGIPAKKISNNNSHSNLSPMLKLD